MFRYHVNITPIDQENAAILVVHHLALAMGYFQALPVDNEHQTLMDEIAKRFEGFNLEAQVATAFADAIREECNALDDLDN